MHAAALIGGLVELHPLFGRQQQQYIESHITLYIRASWKKRSQLGRTRESKLAGGVLLTQTSVLVARCLLIS
jgi:hypothetical protein